MFVSCFLAFRGYFPLQLHVFLMSCWLWISGYSLYCTPYLKVKNTMFRELESHARMGSVGERSFFR